MKRKSSDLTREYYFSIPHHERPGEKIEIFARPHILSFLPDFLLIFFLIFAPPLILAILHLVVTPEESALIINRFSLNIFILALSIYYLAVAFFAFAEWINYYYDVLIVTKTHLINIEQKTLFNREISQMHIGQLEDVTSQIKGFFATLFAYGNIIVQTAGARENTLIKNIPFPQKRSTKIMELHIQAMEDLSQPKATRSSDIEKLFVSGDKIEGK